MFIKYLVFVFKYLSRVFGTTLATTHTFLERNASYIFWTREYVIGFEKNDFSIQSVIGRSRAYRHLTDFWDGF